MPSMQLHSERFLQLAELNKELCKVKGAMEILSESVEQIKYRLKLVTLCVTVARNWIVNSGTGSSTRFWLQITSRKALVEY